MAQSTKEMAPKSGRASKRGRGLLIFLLVVLAAVGTFAIAGWKVLLEFASHRIRYLEKNPPRIEILESSRGVGLAPASFRFQITDEGSGLDEIVVRSIQRNLPHEIKRVRLDGETKVILPLTFRQDKSELDEGVATLEIRAFDRSFWNNSGELVLPLKVDFRRPKIEVVSAQHNAVQGGSQLLFYRAFDEHLDLSGVKVGSNSFLGFPAKGIDRTLTDSSLFAVLYGLPMNEDPENTKLKAFAEDEVGNGASNSSFYYKNSARSHRIVGVKLSDEYLRGTIAVLFQQNFPKLQRNAATLGSTLALSSSPGGSARLVEEFKLVNEKLRALNDTEILGLIQNPRFDRLWDEPFLKQQGSITGAYGDEITYSYEGEDIGTNMRMGYEFSFAQESRAVIAANSGVVMFVENLGIYGRTLAIDHGLGLVSLYGLLEGVSVKKGDSVTRGQEIGTAAVNPTGRGAKAYFEIRVGGVPVDAREWWDRQWLYAHITAKINEIKRSLGIPIYRPLE